MASDTQRTAQELADECQRISDRPMSVLMQDDRSAIREAAAELRRLAALASPVAPAEVLGKMCIDCNYPCESRCFRRACFEPFSNYSGPWRYTAPPAPAQAEQSEDGRDAARYRFLRGDVPSHSIRWARWNVQFWTGRWWEQLQKEKLDAAIDAAIAAKEQQS